MEIEIVAIIEDELNIIVEMEIAILGTSITSESSIIAHAGGGQSLATQLTAIVNRVDTVASDGDSVKLFLAELNKLIIVQNEGVNPLNIFPLLGDNFLSKSANEPIQVVSGNQIKLFCFNVGIWTII